MEMARLQYPGRHGFRSLPVHLDSPSTLVLVFGASELGEAREDLDGLVAAFPRSVVVGCSTAGEIHGSQVRDDSVSVAIARFHRTAVRRATTPISGPDQSYAAGQAIAQALSSAGDGPAPLRAVFMLSDGLCVNGTALVDGARDNLPRGIVITGGLAADGDRFGRTWVLDEQGRPMSGLVSAVGLYGDHLQVGHGCRGGWSGFGPERRITRSHGNVLYELDGKPALALYKTYLGERARGLPGAALLFPLAVRRSAADTQVLTRTVLGIDEERQSLTFAGDMPEGGIAQLMRANTDRLIDSSGLAALNAAHGLDDTTRGLVISVSCVGRRLVLGERTDEELEAVTIRMPTNCEHLGFYSYGEIAPSVEGGPADLHNQTMTVTALAEPDVVPGAPPER